MTMEARAYDLLVRLNLKKTIKQQAVDLFQSASVHKNAKKNDEAPSKIMALYREFRSKLIDFRMTANTLLTYKLNSMTMDSQIGVV